MKPKNPPNAAGANCVGWPPQGKKPCPAAGQDQAFMGRPLPRHPARPSPGSTASPLGSLAKIHGNPPPGPTPENAPSETAQTPHYAHPATPTSGLSSGGPSPPNRRTGAPNNPPAAVAKPVAEWPSHTSAGEQCTPADANTYGRNPGRNNVESGWD